MMDAKVPTSGAVNGEGQGPKMEGKGSQAGNGSQKPLPKLERAKTDEKGLRSSVNAGHVVAAMMQETYQLRDQVIKIFTDWSNVSLSKDRNKMLTSIANRTKHVLNSQAKLKELAKRLEVIRINTFKTPLRTNPLAVLPWSPPKLGQPQGIPAPPSAREKLQKVGKRAAAAVSTLERYAYARDDPCLALRMTQWKATLRGEDRNNISDILRIFNTAHPNIPIHQIKARSRGALGILLSIPDVCYVSICFSKPVEFSKTGRDLKVDIINASGWLEGKESAITASPDRSLIFRSMTAQCAVALQGINKAFENDGLAALERLLEWVVTYRTLFTSKCSWCNRYISREGGEADRMEFIPATVRTLPDGRSFHPQCREVGGEPGCKK